MWEILYRKILPFLYTGEFTQEKSFISVLNVRNLLPLRGALFIIKEITLEKGLMSAMNVGNSLSDSLLSLNTVDLTLGKKPFKYSECRKFLHLGAVSVIREFIWD